jgi:GNAT superfamily N-acetyltransferase
LRVRVQSAEYRDVRSWLDLAAEVEGLFGDQLGDPDFYQALLRNIGRATAFCVREGDGPAGARLAGGMLFSPRWPERPEYRISWLAVAERCRRHGIARLLVQHAFNLVEPPAVLAVGTFGEDLEPGRPARRLYERMGFHPAELLPPGRNGGSRQVYRREFR